MNKPVHLINTFHPERACGAAGAGLGAATEENLWHPAWWASLFAIVALTALGMGVALLATFGILKLKPLGLLQAG